jgi:release factor glutamine methyltransferase
VSELTLTLSTLLADGRAKLSAAGIPEPGREALRLWADLNDEVPARSLLERDRTVAPIAAGSFLTAVERRAQGEPLAYVTGWAGFRRLELRIDRRALIPRPETEGLVELVLKRADGGRVADLGTGSGCIALSLATEGGYDAVVGVERSAATLALASVNRTLTGGAVDFVRSDLTAALAAASFDVLVSNPPYLTAREHEELEPAVSQWEPREALVSGEDGLGATARLLDDGRRVLRPGGWLALELDANRAATVAALAWGLGWEAVEVCADLFGRERYLLARRSERS